jgi:hypothetical protein
VTGSNYFYGPEILLLMKRCGHTNVFHYIQINIIENQVLRIRTIEVNEQ